MTFQEMKVDQFIPILIIWLFSVIILFYPQLNHCFSKLLSSGVASLKEFFANIKLRKKMKSITIDEIMETVGYAYGSEQDIFYSNIDAWQRNMGYCRLYDEAAAPLSMIIDCEPIYFDYDNKKWMIEFWKGQYGMTTGCEIGVYSTEGPELNIPGVFNGTFYHCAGDEDLLKMTFVLRKNGKVLFTRRDKHWWLTGFKLGEFSEPSELTMNLYVTLKDNTMCSAFIEGLIDAGYSQNEIVVSGNTVGVNFDEPKTTQPITRTKRTDRITQRKNKLLCDTFQEITKEYDNSLDKIKAIQEQTPEMLEKVFNIGKTKLLFRKYKIIKKYLK